MAVSSSNPWARSLAPGPHDTDRSQLRPTAQQSVSLSYKYAPTLSLPLSSSPLAKFSNPPASLPFSKFPMAQEDVIATEPSPVQQPSPKKPSSPPAVVKSGSFREESNSYSDSKSTRKRPSTSSDPSPIRARRPAASSGGGSAVRRRGKAENADDGRQDGGGHRSTSFPAAPRGAAESPRVLWGVPLLEREPTPVLLKFLRGRDFRMRRVDGDDKAQTKIGGRSSGSRRLAGGGPRCVYIVAGWAGRVHGGGVDREGPPVWSLPDLQARRVSTGAASPTSRHSPGLLKAELRQALDILQNNYPEFVAKQIFINVPWWYLAFNKMISPFLTQRTKSKFVFAGPSRSAETLFNYISPEQVPVRFGGLLTQENDPDFAPADVVTEVTVKPGSKQIIEMPAAEKCLLVWELRVLGWDVSIGAEFVPSSEDGYTVIIDKLKKLGAKDEAVAKNSFKIAEPGKVVITVDNATSKKKKLLYRYKSKECTESV
ncbi:patellin-1-like [Asparagus officinalis]|uniref:patellin-1-like n=1 Tax=Asparagus officinalis TaxID=4686 RepID=UPI00098E7CD5|nr:patellin-1-like [Asparagus officinalis]